MKQRKRWEGKKSGTIKESKRIKRKKMKVSHTESIFSTTVVI